MRLLLGTLLVVAIGCGDDSAPGLRGECASFGGAGLECERPPIESAADACHKLVDCGTIPLVADGGFDWAACMRELERLDDFNRDVVLSCIEVSSCDELGSGRPLCLQHGDR